MQSEGKNLRFCREVNLGIAHWVGAVKRDAEGSHMQLRFYQCQNIQARIGTQ